MGDPLDEQTDLGPLISEQAAERVHREVLQCIEMGAECLIGGKRVGKQFYAPTVLVNINDDMPCITGEVFGPVVPVAPFASLASVVEEMNSAPYGLQASVFSSNIHEALGVAHRLQVGGVVVNGAVAFASRQCSLRRIQTQRYWTGKHQGHRSRNEPGNRDRSKSAADILR